MARGIIRKPSFRKIVGAYRSQFKRFLMRVLTFGAYGSKGMGWFRNPKKAWYNFWYNRTSVSIYKLLGFRPSRAASFLAIIAAAVFLPIDAIDSGGKANKIKKARKERESCESSPRTTSTSGEARSDSSPRITSTSGEARSDSSNTVTRSPSETSPPRISTNTTTSRTTTAPKSSSTPRVTSSATSPRKQNSEKATTPNKVEKTKEIPELPRRYVSTYQPTVSDEQKEPDENTPKSKPKHEKDQYIRKRMIIAGSSYCDKEVLAKLSIGTYFDLAAEPDNPYDKDAVMLTLDGEKIGYISKADRLAFVTCLKLKRKMYGVITDIKTDEPTTKYEFETWFDNEK